MTTSFQICRSDVVSSGYYSKCIDLIKSMHYGEIRSLDKANPNYSRFVATMKLLIDENMDKFHNCEIEFNPDYTAFRKLETFEMFMRGVGI